MYKFILILINDDTKTNPTYIHIDFGLLFYSPRGQGIEPESSGGYTPRERGRTRERRPRERSGGILDIGFDGLLDQPRRGGASQVPHGLQYQPS